ncbi:putative neutral zinc metallopeptidase protein [Golovinomyces cichoracearum]|uniref:Putative neutral zinc metallopeptidase protein n=1 Tax=Golovinomyces cichoracearum TaxID=62708 RepID=A0A420ISS6_9PEZI|nr:putative neutral zinc metallopeptidase protein [Golovinomyces cichoracearum]
MDYIKLRAVALKDGDDEEAVTVNTRALIDKVLARYSGEWTTLRELIQNAADAQASTVTIKFDTLPSIQIPTPSSTNSSEILKHTLQNHTLQRLVVSNDGQKFGANDWSRLKRIAEGNPDETKIGAFGVGFYSVFSECEDPFVSSGNEAMAFYWKGNSLFTKRVQLPPEQGNPGTSFVLDYRNTTSPLPNLISLAQFLATSLTFVALSKIELWVDAWKIISVQKKPAPSIEIPIARDLETRTKGGFMRVHSLERESIQMDATFMNVVSWKPSLTSVSKLGGSEIQYGSSNNDIPSLRSFFSRLTSGSTQAQNKSKLTRDEKQLQEIILEDLTALTTTHVFLRVTTAVIQSSVGGSFAAELERATKKPPPRSTKIAILTSSYDQAEASSKVNPVAKSVDIFASVLPGTKPGGRVFIGFPTHQTTGAGIHLSAQSVIPTVERESIDLNARWVRSWNEEMLRASGIIARLAFSSEMADFALKIKNSSEKSGTKSKMSKTEISAYMNEAFHILNTFTFGESTPSSKVSQIIEEAFWTAYRQPSIEIYSSCGVLMTSKVRLTTEDLSGFVEGIPVVPAQLAEHPFVIKLKNFGLLTEITISDVKKELEAKALDKDQLSKFIGWAMNKVITGEIEDREIRSLFDVAVATTGDKEGSEIVALSGIKNFHNVNLIPSDVPLPESTIPFYFTKSYSFDRLRNLGWEQLEIVPWLYYLIETNNRRPSEQDLKTSVPFAAHILQILSKSWETLNQSSKNTVISLLQPISVIPTKSGMKKPSEAFLANVKLFEDLPTVVSCPAVKEKFLAAIGVRKTVDLETIFNRLLSPNPDALNGGKSSNCRHMEVIKYLASVKDDIPQEDMKKLKNSPICPAETGPPGNESTKGTLELFKVSELFEPKDAIRDLKLPVIQWPGPPGSYRARSIEGRFLSSLGLRIFPSVPELINLMASEDSVISDKAMFYFIAHHHTNGYASFQMSSTTKKFLPLLGEEKRVSPSECYTNERCSILGFKILKRELAAHANKFGVATDPPMDICVERLVKNPPRDVRSATLLFQYFSERLGEIGTIHVLRLEQSSIVPVRVAKSISDTNISEDLKKVSSLRLLTPKQCYLGTPTTYGEIFDFVDFGNAANTFLLRCGSKNEPTTLELASLACKEPARLLGIMKSPENYLSLLRNFADELPQLRRDNELFKKMRQSKWLLASFEISTTKDKLKIQQSDRGEEVYDSDPEDNEETKIKEYQLARPDQIIVNDNYTSYRLFKQSLISAPEEEKLEDFYLALGAQTLNSLVQEDLRLGQPYDRQNSAVKIRSHILERSKLFLYEHKRESIRHDVKWLEKNLSVQVVKSIALRRSLKGHSLSHTEKRLAACNNDFRNGWTLYITPGEYDSYQISQSLCRILLERPNHSSYLTFESFLSLNLYQLRSRGYNVERILRAKAAEQRIAEEERKKQLEAEQKLIREQEEQWKKSQMLPVPIRKEQTNLIENKMPGAFDESSPENSPFSSQKKTANGIFSGLSKRLGLNNLANGEIQEQLTSFLGNNSSQTKDRPRDPPSYEEASKGSVYSPATLQQNLLNAIQSSRAHDSNILFSPPSTQIIKEQASYCDSKSAQDIYFLAEANNGTRIYVSKTATVNSRELLSTNVDALNKFAGLLHEVADIYSLPRKAIHIFIDEAGSTIAFNSSGSIFCNFRFFKQLHSNRASQSEGKVVATSYWWVVVAHELAHNVVAAHNSEHSFYTESLIGNFFLKMMAKAIIYQETSELSAPTDNQKQRSLLD